MISVIDHKRAASTRRELLASVLAAALPAAGQTTKTRNLILITADGLRWQELFRGIDPKLMYANEAGMKDAAPLVARLSDDKAEARRAKLMPFFWSKFAARGVVIGNRDRDSKAEVTNAYRVSYPGYSEILTGRAQDDAIRGNAKIQNPSMTVLEFLRERLKLPPRSVALFGSWDVFPFIGEQRAGSVFINAGYQALNPEEAVTARMRELSAMQFDLRTPWDSVRHDYITVELAFEYLKHVKPRVLYIALGEPDDWAHDKRYDRALQAIQYLDRVLERLWNQIEGMSEYRGVTSIVLTTDHGRGPDPENWHSHGAKIEGAEQIWVAAAGPDTPPTGEATGVAVHQRDVAATMLALMGVDPTSMPGMAGKPIPAILGR